MTIFNDIFSDIQSSFNSLWKFKRRGRTLEIITPYATTSSKFVSVFLSEINNEYVVSDGGWINEGIYDNTFDIEDCSFLKIVDHYINCFDIKQTKGIGDKTYFYKKTIIKSSVPSLVMDLSVFISNIISLAEIEFSDKEEREYVARFGTRVNTYLQSFIQKDKIDTMGYLDEKRTIKLSAIIKPTHSKLILINYITGSNPSHFTNSISKANFIFELAEGSKYRNHIGGKISIIDNLSNGYQPDKFAGFLKHLNENTKASEVNWSDKEKLKEMVSM